MDFFNIMFFINSIALGVGLAMDSFSVSIANAIAEPQMKKSKMCGVAGIYAFFQFAMPMTGWLCVHTIAEKFTVFQKFIPWIALILLLYIGIKMIIECILENKKADSQVESDPAVKSITPGLLIIQGIATSIDALSVGFTIADYNWLAALIASLIIAVVTFAICMIGLLLGKKASDKLGSGAEIVGGVILILIGIEIFVKGVFFS